METKGELKNGLVSFTCGRSIKIDRMPLDLPEDVEDAMGAFHDFDGAIMSKEGRALYRKYIASIIKFSNPEMSDDDISKFKLNVDDANEILNAFHGIDSGK